MIEELVKFLPCELDAVIEVTRSLSEELEACFEGSDFVRGYWIDVIVFFHNGQGALGHLGEQLAEEVFGPLDAVDSLFWEHFQGAHGDVCVIFWVSHLPVRFCLPRQDHLDMAFRT